MSTSTNQISNPTSTFLSPTENPYSALHPAYSSSRPPVHPNGRTPGLTQSQYLQQQHEPQYQSRNAKRNSDYHNPQISHQPSGQTPRQSDSPRGPPPYGVPFSITFTPPGSHYGGSQNGSQYTISGGGRMTTSSPVPPPPSPFSAPEDSSPSYPHGSVSPRGLASGAHFDSSSFVSHYSSANEVLANGGSLRRQPKRRPPSANNSSHYGGGGSERGSDISLTEVGNSAGLFGARISHSTSGGTQHQPYYLSQSAAGSRAPLPGFSSFVWSVVTHNAVFITAQFESLTRIMFGLFSRFINNFFLCFELLAAGQIFSFYATYISITLIASFPTILTTDCSKCLAYFRLLTF